MHDWPVIPAEVPLSAPTDGRAVQDWLGAVYLQIMIPHACASGHTQGLHGIDVSYHADRHAH